MGSDVVMTDSGSAPPDTENELLTTGRAALVIGVTRRQVIEMVDNDEIAYFRPGPRQWARIPMAAATAKREELKARAELERRELEERVRQQEQRASAELDRLSRPWGTE